MRRHVTSRSMCEGPPSPTSGRSAIAEYGVRAHRSTSSRTYSRDPKRAEKEEEEEEGEEGGEKVEEDERRRDTRPKKYLRSAAHHTHIPSHAAP